MSKDKKKDKVEELKKPKTKKVKKAAVEASTVVDGAGEPPSPEVVAAKPAKTALKKPRVKKAPTAPKEAAQAAEIVLEVEEVSLRAYFISERRRDLALPGDDASDWLQAETELRFEAIERLGIKP